MNNNNKEVIIQTLEEVLNRLYRLEIDTYHNYPFDVALVGIKDSYKIVEEYLDEISTIDNLP